MSKKLEKHIQILEELVRKADSLISPITYHHKLQWLLNKDARKELFERNPKAFLPIKMDEEIPFFPITNRMGMHDPDVITFSLKLANRLKGDPRIDQDHLYMIVTKLERLQKKYENEVPKPAGAAAKKALITKLIQKIGNYLQGLK